MTRFSSMRPIHRLKHIIDAEGALVAGTQSVTTLVKGADAPVITSPTEVETGSKVNGIYLHVEVSHTSGVGRPNVYLAVLKNPIGTLGTITNINSLGDSPSKKFFIHQEMIMMSGDAGNGLPRPIFNGVIKIPKHMQRFARDDLLQVVLLSPTVAADFCLQCHYKEFR